jgi:eukaryotic-like serine/threonine-protein kinase
MNEPADGRSGPVLDQRRGADPARRLWALWRQGQRPDMREFLSHSGHLIPAQVAAVLLVDQRERWQQGERIPAETYVELCLDLQADVEFVVELAYGEFLLLEELGETPKSDEYLRRFPQHAERLRLQFDLHQAVKASEALAPASSALGESTEQTQPDTGLKVSPEIEPAWPVLPGYEILEELGHGGMGIVYRARQVELNRLVALKMIRAGEDAGPEQMARFQVEAEAVARLQHSHIVQIYEIGKQVRHKVRGTVECPYMALEFVNGGSLAEHLAGRPQPPRQSAQLVQTVARAMHFAHQRGILHRDLKPSNILLQKDSEILKPESKSETRNPKSEKEALANGSNFEFRISDLTPKVSDFGLAKVLEEGNAGQTQTGSVLGTPGYMAPEQAAGNSRETGVPADVHALGVILYEMLTGRPPFRGATPVETLDQVRSQEPMPPSRLQPSLPRDLETICLKCLQKEPGRRYQTAAELAADLQHFIDDEPISARRASARERVLKWSKRHPALAALWSVSGLAIVAVMLVVLVWNARLQTQRDLADSRRQEAVANLSKAREVVDRLVTRLAELKLKDTPQMELVRRELFEDAVKYYEDFARQSEADPKIRLELGRTQRRLGNYYKYLSQQKLAKNVLNEALATLEALNADFPSVSEYRQELALATQSMGEFLSYSGELSRAQALLQRTVDLQSQLIGEHPDEPAFRTNLSGTYTRVGINCGKMGRPQDQLDAFRNSEQVLQALVRLYPDELGYAELLAVTRGNLAGALSVLGRQEEAEEVLRANLTFWEKMLTQSSDKDARSKLALTVVNLGLVLREAGKLQRAEEAFRRAVDLQQKLADDFPRVPYRHAVLAVALDSLAGLLVTRGELAEAQRLFELSVRHQKTRQELEPNATAALQDLCKTYFTLAETLLRARDHTTGARRAVELSSLAPSSQETQVKAASLLARCATVVERDTGLPAIKRREAAQEYATRAVELLGKAVKDGLPSLESVEKDRSFDGLRSRSDYQKLLQRLTNPNEFN